MRDKILDFSMRVWKACAFFVYMTKGMADVMFERKRQVYVLGFDAPHDDNWNRGELKEAAIVYIDKHLKRSRWPFGEFWYRPKDERQNLVRAAAMLIAEIDRLDRIEMDKFLDERRQRREEEKTIRRKGKRR